MTSPAHLAHIPEDLLDNAHTGGVQLFILEAGQVVEVELVDSFETGAPQVELFTVHLVMRHPRLMIFSSISAAARVGFRVKLQTRAGLLFYLLDAARRRVCLGNRLLAGLAATCHWCRLGATALELAVVQRYELLDTFLG